MDTKYSYTKDHYGTYLWQRRITQHALCWLFLLTLLPVTPLVSMAQTSTRTFTETGKTVQGKFLHYWEQHGGLAQQGYPVSEEMEEKNDADGKVYNVQYFERAVFELHPEHVGTPHEVQLSLLGIFEYQRRYGQKSTPPQKASTDNPITFKETGKTLGGKFRVYWETHGGLAQQGFPITEEFQEISALDGSTHLVQYFERAVFELHPEYAGTPHEVQLAHLGAFQYRAKYLAWINEALTRATTLRSYRYTLDAAGDVFLQPTHMEGEYVYPSSAYMKGMVGGTPLEQLVIGDRVYFKRNGEWVLRTASTPIPGNVMPGGNAADTLLGEADLVSVLLENFFQTPQYYLVGEETINGIRTRHFTTKVFTPKEVAEDLLGDSVPDAANLPPIGDGDLWIGDDMNVYKITLRLDFGAIVEKMKGFYVPFKFDITATFRDHNDPGISIPNP
jgi:hypothetical protein